ncbi:hypothetical protein [Microbispora sp. NPDC049125]|uniref:hypothetical protein n=1 Tax=Microbispora sp. NPDC049125 TaxID=3154929 RepID=UPI0034677819
MSTTTTADLRSRMPNPLPFLPEMAAIAEPLHRVIANGVIPAATVSLLQLRAGQILGRASELYDDKALWHLIMAIAHIGFFTPAALIAKPIPGMPPGRNYS